MRPNSVTFWGFFLALLAIGLSAGTDVFSNHQAVNETVVVLSSAALALLVLNQIWPQPLTAVAGRFRRAPENESEPFIALAEAARLAYEVLRNDMIGRLAARSPDGPLSYMAQWIADKGVPIYGERHPSTVREKLPSELLRAAGITYGADRFEREGWDTYVALVVRRSEIGALLEPIRDQLKASHK